MLVFYRTVMEKKYITNKEVSIRIIKQHKSLAPLKINDCSLKSLVDRGCRVFLLWDFSP